MKHFLYFLVCGSFFLSVGLAQEANPVRSVTDPGVVTTRQTITPAGVPTVFKGKVHGVAFGESAKQVWALTASELYALDWNANQVHTRIAVGGLPGFLGLASQSGMYVAAVPSRQKAGLFQVRDGKLVAVAADIGQTNTGGLAVGSQVAVVPMTSQNKLAVVQLATGEVKWVSTGMAPFAAVLNQEGTVAYVSNWGGRVPKAGDKTAATGLAANADQVVVDGQGITGTGTVTRVDLRTMMATHTIATGLHPNGMVWDEANGRLYVANNNSESVTVIDTAKQTPLRQISIQPFAKEVTGIAPTAVVLSKDRKKLYVTCGGINAVAVIDTTSNQLAGLIPTGWYPNAIALSPEGTHLAVGSLLGVGSGWQNEPKRRFVHSNRGTVHVMPVPDGAQLAAYTLAVSENNRVPLKGTAMPIVTKQSVPKAVPASPGDPSLISHVVYIVKENRTYDQLFGDLEKGNGEPNFVMFGEDTTPNQRALARQFVLLDNFYASGGNSADGHQWLTQANEVAYTMWPGYQGRSYPFDGTDPIGIARGGTIWDLAIKNGKTVRIFGEYAGRMPEPASQRHDNLRKWKQGDDFSKTFSIKPPIAHMTPFVAANYPAYGNAIPDQIRADIFLQQLREWESGGGMPNLTILQLPCDHTYGTSPGASSPKSMVADNDLAVGRIVEALSKSKYWSKMAIFIVEDDAQNGVDHVDGHRTVALAVSPYIRRGTVDSTFYSNPSMLKTMELMLGLPTLSLFDLIANDMRAGFTDTPDLAPFTHVVPKQDLFERNPEAKALQGAARTGALASARMRWDVPDAVPTEKLNRILWHSIKGWNVAYPQVKNAVFAPISLDVDDDDREEAREKGRR